MYRIFTTTQMRVLTTNTNNEKPLMGVDNKAIPFLIINAENDLLPGGSFTIDLDSQTPGTLEVETKIYRLIENFHDQEFLTVPRDHDIHSFFFVESIELFTNFTRYHCIKAAPSILVTYPTTIQRREVKLL